MARAQFASCQLAGSRPAPWSFRKDSTYAGVQFGRHKCLLMAIDLCLRRDFISWQESALGFGLGYGLGFGATRTAPVVVLAFIKLTK